MKSFYRYLSQYINLVYVVKFLLLLMVLYGFNWFYIGLTVPGGLYSPFLDHYVNYIAWLRSSILYTSNSMAHGLGLNSYTVAPKYLKTSGAGVHIAFECLGVGIFSFWLAYVIADTANWKRKFVWCSIGMATIFLINCLRIAVLLYALDKKWEVNKYADHHTLFNIAGYTLIIVLIYLYNLKGPSDNRLNSPGSKPEKATAGKEVQSAVDGNWVV